MSKTVLLMGATGGVGAEAGRMLVAGGYHVIATCRKQQQADELVASKLCHVALLMDLADNDSIDSVFAEMTRMGVPSLAAIVNCAAVLSGAPLEIVSAREVEGIFRANVFGTLRVVQLAIPLLRPDRGRIILVGSLAGSFVMPLTGAYSASKFALEGLCDGLRRELYPWGIQVSLIKPGAIDTRMYQAHLEDVDRNLKRKMTGVEALYRPLYAAHALSIPKTRKMAVSTERVASYVITALEVKRAKARYYPSLESKLVRYLTPIMPDTWLDRFAAKVFPLDRG